MDLDFFRKFIDLLQFKSTNWGLVIDRQFRKFFSAIASVIPQTISEFLSSVLADFWPSTTTLNADWSRQFGKTFTLSNNGLVGQWANTGGQSPSYLQGVLRRAGFDVYVHEWWVPGTDPPTARDASLYWDSNTVLVNDVKIGEKNYTSQFEPNTTVVPQCKPISDITTNDFGAYSGILWRDKVYENSGSPGGEDILINGNFETTILDDWTLDNGLVSQAAFVPTGLESSSTYSSEMPENSAIVQDVLTDGVDYVIEGWVYVDDVSEVGVNIVSCSGSLVFTSTLYGEWEFVSETFTATSNTEVRLETSSEGSMSGYFDLFTIRHAEPRYPNYFYVGGETWPDRAFVAVDRFEEFKSIIYKIKPLFLRCILLIDTAEIWQDVYTGQDETIQDVIVGDEIQDIY